MPLLGIFLKKTKARSWTDIHARTFTAELFRIATIWKQPQRPSRDERMKKMSHTHTEENGSAIKKAWNLAICDRMDGPIGPSVQSLSCDPMDCSTPGFPVHHQHPEPAQTHVHRVSVGHCMKLHKSKRNTACIYTQNLKIETNEQPQQNRNGLIERGSWQGAGGEGEVKCIRELKREKLPATKWIKEMKHRAWGIRSVSVIRLYSDRW